MTLDGLALHTTPFMLAELSMQPPRKRTQWLQGVDADGSALVADPRFENREIVATLHVLPQASMDLALDQIGELVDKLEEAEQQPDGLALVWTPADSTRSITFYVLSGEIDDMPVSIESGWFVKAPTITIRMVCKPFGYGTPVTSSTSSGSDPVLTFTLASVAGDVPAEARLIVTDTASQSRRHVEWGLEQRYYNAATSLIIDSDSLVTSGFAGTGTTRTGAYDPNASGNNVIRATVQREVQAVCGTGNLGHVGVFRVKARVFSDYVDNKVRLAWQDGDGPFRANDWAIPAAVDVFCEVDLGLISISPTQLGTQKWSGRIEGMSSTSKGLEIDYLVLIPVGEGYGKARATYGYSAGVQNARDEFTSTTAGNVLNARVAPSGGTWATSGATTDFVFADFSSGGLTTETVTRGTSADASRRFAILGSTTFTDTEAQVDIRLPDGVDSNSANSPRGGVITRWVDSSNYLRADIKRTNDVSVYQVVAGVETRLWSGYTSIAGSAWYTLRLLAFASGRFVVMVLNSSGGVLLSGEGASSALATGGALATGKPGFFDHSPGTVANDRHYDNFSHATPAAEPVVVYSGQSCEFRHDDPLREDSSGTYWGPLPSYRGSRFLVPPAGDENRTSRILVKARRADVDAAPDLNVADAVQAQIVHTPRYLAVAR